MTTKRRNGTELTETQLRVLFPDIMAQIDARKQMTALRQRVGVAKQQITQTRHAHALRIANRVHPMDMLTLSVHPTLESINKVFGSYQTFADACEAMGIYLPKDNHIARLDTLRRRVYIKGS